MKPAASIRWSAADGKARSNLYFGGRHAGAAAVVGHLSANNVSLLRTLRARMLPAPKWFIPKICQRENDRDLGSRLDQVQLCALRSQLALRPCRCPTS